MNRNLFNLEKLIRSGQERVRLTEQLQELVCEAVYEIAEAVSVGTKVTVAGETFAVLEFCSNIGCTTQFCLIKDADFGYAVIFDDGREPGARFYLHGDFDCQLENASREDFLHVANNLPEIIAAFQANQEKINASLREAFERLKAQAGEA